MNKGEHMHYFDQQPRTTGIGVIFSVLLAGLAFSQDRHERVAPRSIVDRKLETPLAKSGASLDRLHPSLLGAEGREQIIVRLKTPTTGPVDFGRLVDIEAEQDGFLNRCLEAVPGTLVIARTRLVLNAVFLEVDAAALPQIALDPAVMAIRPVGNYEMALSETVPYIGASALHSGGLDGSGVRVAILDSGIDYTHANFGGPGTVVHALFQCGGEGHILGDGRENLRRQRRGERR